MSQPKRSRTRLARADVARSAGLVTTRKTTTGWEPPMRPMLLQAAIRLKSPGLMRQAAVRDSLGELHELNPKMGMETHRRQVAVRAAEAKPTEIRVMEPSAKFAASPSPNIQMAGGALGPRRHKVEASRRERPSSSRLKEEGCNM